MARKRIFYVGIKLQILKVFNALFFLIAKLLKRDQKHKIVRKIIEIAFNFQDYNVKYLFFVTGQKIFF